MGNKLRNIFSDEEITINGKINFKDPKAYTRFIEALEKVQEEGKLVKVEGIDSVETLVQTGKSIYPVASHENICEFVVAPSTEEVRFELETEYGKKELILKRYCINKGIILQTSEDAIVFLKLFFEKSSIKTKINYQVQPENAKSVKELLVNYSIILSFFNRLFKQDIDQSQDGITIKNMKDYFGNAIEGYKKLEFLENEFSIKFDPKALSQNVEPWLELEELYLVLKEKKAIRLSAKVNDTETTGMKVNQQEENIKKGAALDITFMMDIVFSLWNNSITIYAACFLSNAIVKDINELPDGEVNILYGGEDSRPMYISYRGFKTEKEAEEEMKNIMNHKEDYVDALTVMGHINKKESDLQ